MTNSNIRKLAKFIVTENLFNENVASDLIKKLTKKQISTFVKYLKLEFNKQTVVIYSKIQLPIFIKSELEKNYLGKKILYKIDETLSEGIKVITNDTVINLTIKGYFNGIMDSIKK